MFSIEGVVGGGTGTAHQNLVAQLPAIAAEFPEIANAHHGTLNLTLQVPLLVLTPDHRTKPIAWAGPNQPSEVFDLLRIEIEAPIGSTRQRAWLYIAHFSPHRQTLHVHEVLASKLDVKVGHRCRLHIDRNAGQVPYGSYPVVIVL